MQAGRISEGLARFDSAARLYAAAGLPLAEHYLEYVDALVDLRLLPEALATSRAAVDELDGSDVRADGRGGPAATGPAGAALG